MRLDPAAADTINYVATDQAGLTSTKKMSRSSLLHELIERRMIPEKVRKGWGDKRGRSAFEGGWVARRRN
jgi:hypothetical protein